MIVRGNNEKRIRNGAQRVLLEQRGDAQRAWPAVGASADPPQLRTTRGLRDRRPPPLPRPGRAGHRFEPGRGVGKSPLRPPFGTQMSRSRLPEGPAGLGPGRPGERVARKRGAGRTARPARRSPRADAEEKSHLPRRDPETAESDGGAGRPGAGSWAGGGRGPAGRGGRCSAPRTPPTPSGQPHPRRRSARGGPRPLRQAAPVPGVTSSSRSL